MSAQKSLLLACVAILTVHCSESPEPDRQSATEVVAEEPPESLPAGIVVPESAWETLATGLIYTDAPVSDGNGGVYFAAPIQNRIYHLTADGSSTVLAEDTQMNMGLATGPDRRLYGCRNRGAQIVVYAEDGSFEVLLQGKVTPLPDKPEAPGEFCNDLVVNAAGGIWFTDRVNQRVIYLAPDRTVRTVAEGFRPNGIALSPDGRVLVVTDSNEPRIHAFAVGADGALEPMPDYFPPLLTVERLGTEAIAPDRPGTNGITVDSDGRYYVSSFYGIQVFAADGSFLGSMSKPVGFVSNLGFAGPELEYLYASGLNGLYRRPMQARGVPLPDRQPVAE